MAEKRLHHYVPQFYLRGFVNPSAQYRRKPTLWVHDYNLEIVAERSTRQIAAEVGYYAIETPHGRDYETLENELSTRENQAMFALHQFLNRPVGNRQAMSPEIGTFIAWLACRVPWFKRVAMEGWQNHLSDMAWGKAVVEDDSDISNLMIDENTGEERRFPLQPALAAVRSGQWTAKMDQNQVLDMMRLQRWHFQHEHFPRLFWTILTASHGDCFITSDRPVVWYVPTKGFSDSPAALKEPSVELTVSLNRDTALLGTPLPPPLGTQIRVSDINYRTRCFAERLVVAGDASSLHDERNCFV